MSGLITMGLGSKQTLLTLGLGSPGTILPPIIIPPHRGGAAKGYALRKKERDEEFIEKWIIEVSGVDIYSKVEKEVDMKPNIIVKVGDKEVRLDRDDSNMKVTVEQVRVNIE